MGKKHHRKRARAARTNTTYTYSAPITSAIHAYNDLSGLNMNIYTYIEFPMDNNQTALLYVDNMQHDIFNFILYNGGQPVNYNHQYRIYDTTYNLSSVLVNNDQRVQFIELLQEAIKYGEQAGLLPDYTTAKNEIFRLYTKEAYGV